ncbi:MAG: DsrE family protein [Firmicutes bacterium]|nr:DsrE family protein [Bacillota bacterium]
MAFNTIEEVTERHLHILWTNGDPVTSKNMVFMYARNSMLNHWWDKVTVIVWGAPQLTLFENEEVREAMNEARLAGAEISACASCAANLRTTEKLQAEGIEVIRWGEKLSLLMQNGRHVLSV